MADLKGTYPVLPCIFDRLGAVDEAGLAACVAFAVAAGVDGVVFPGLASEYDQLTLDERLATIALVGEAARGKANFIVGGASDDPALTERIVAAGAEAGAVAAMVLTPKAYAGDHARITAFYDDLGRIGALDILLQNAPKPMGLGLPPGDVAAIARAVPQVRYLKEETMPCGQQITALRANVPPQVKGIFGGAGGRYILDELERGAVGTMPALELADVHAQLMEAWVRGDRDTATRLYERMLPILTLQAVFRWHLTKSVLKLRGVIEDSHVRAPGPRLDVEDLRQLERWLGRLSDVRTVHPRVGVAA